MDTRSSVILHLLIESEQYISIKELAGSLNVSKRTIYNDIEKINDWLTEEYDRRIEKVHGLGIYIPREIKPAIRSSIKLEDISYYEYSKDERLAWIFLLLTLDIKRPYFIDSFQRLFKVSRNTVIDDIKQVRHRLNNHDIMLTSTIPEGYVIDGNEIFIRQMIMETVHHLFYGIRPSTEDNLFDILPDQLLHSSDIQLIENMLVSYEQGVGVEITEDIRPMIATWMFCFLQRMKNNKTLSLNRSEKEAIKSAPEYKITYRIFNQFIEDISDDESVYLTRILLGAKIKFSKSSDYEIEDILNLEVTVNNLIDDFQQKAAVIFSERDALYQHLLLHLKPAYYRIKYQINISNPLKDKIKQDYKAIFSLTRQIIRPLEMLIGQKINDDELAYIAIHFGGWLKRNALTIKDRILKIMIVCINGIGTSRIMENQTINLLPEYEIVSLFAESDYEKTESLVDVVDFVVSSIPLEDKGVPVIVVNPLFSSRDREALLSQGKLDEYIYRENRDPKVDTLIDIIKKYAEVKNFSSLRKELTEYLSPTMNTENDNKKPNLEDLLPHKRIQVINQVDDWEEGIDTASKALIEDECIEHSYVKAMKRIIKEKGTYMVLSDSIAFLHALPTDGVKQTGMSLLLLKNNVKMKDKSVKLFMILASEDNENHLKAMAELTKILSDKVRKDHILNAVSRHEIIRALNFNPEEGDDSREIPYGETD